MKNSFEAEPPREPHTPSVPSRPLPESVRKMLEIQSRDANDTLLTPPSPTHHPEEDNKPPTLLKRLQQIKNHLRQPTPPKNPNNQPSPIPTDPQTPEERIQALLKKMGEQED